MADVVLDMRDRRPIWAVPAWAVEEIRAALPEGWTLFEATTVADGSGDGGGVGPGAGVLDALEGARVYLGYGVHPRVLEAGGDTLRWVHSGAAGVGSSLHGPMRERIASGQLVFTNSAGIHGPPMAETVLAMILHFLRGLDLARQGQAEGRWNAAPFWRADAPLTELSQVTVGIVGYGGIGREIARRTRALGARTLGLRRTPPEAPVDDLGVEVLAGHGPEGLGRLLEQSEVLVVVAPETPATRGLLGRARLEALPRGAIVVNAARGSLVDEGALAELLASGHLRGAGLDVFATEPLPPESPLWALSNVLITPHVSAVSQAFWRRETDLIVENLAALLEERPLRNRVDPEAGY
jgi:phosphoglycerate dehydrogenase-like enzyme